jgi:fibronectin type 3 domain-containing protein
MTYTDRAVANGSTYYYTVSATNAWGESPASYPAAGSPLPAPPAPTNLTAAGGDQMVHLTWTGSSLAEYYEIWRATTAGGPYTWAGYAYETTGDDYGYGYIGDEPPLQNGVRYYYVVTAVNSIGSSGYSNEASAVPVGPPAPPAPTGLAAAPGDQQVTLTWNASPGATGYYLKRSAASGGPYTVFDTSYGGTSYLVAGLTNGQTTYYTVSAFNSGGESPDSNVVSAAPSGPPPPAPPTNLTASAGKKKVTLAWTQSSGGAAQNRIYRSTTNGGPYSRLATVSARTSYPDTAVPGGRTYYYRVTAIRDGIESAYSNQVGATPR